MKKNFVLGTLVASILLTGCGGGGGGSHGGGGTTPVSTQIRALAPNTFAYNLSGTLTTPANGTQTLTASSQRSIVVTSEATSGQFKLDGTDAVVVNEGSPSTALNFDVEVSQQPNRAVLARSVDLGDGIKNLNSPTLVFLPGTFTTNTTSAPQTFSFTDGTTATYTFQVGGIESVQVPFGTFDAYVVTSSITLAPDNKRTGTYYYVPTLGTYVKAVETITRPDGVASVTAELRAVS
jgi:hypothetical protein